MENLLIRNVNIFSISGNFTRKMDVRIHSGKILEQGEALVPTESEVVWEGREHQDYYLSPAWTDLFSVVTDPGFEWKESYAQWANQAAEGGMGRCLVIPDTSPSVDKGEMVRSLKARTNAHGVEMLVAANITQGRLGKQLSEMRDCYEAGTRIFSEGLKPSLSAARMRIALEYAGSFGGKLMVFPQEGGMAESGQIHEGKASLATGLTGIHSLSESLMVYRDSELALLTGTEIHFCGISSAESVEIIRKAKEKGAPVTASVFAPHLVFTEAEVEGFDPLYKVMPPFRSQADRDALRKAIQDGVIDGIASGHVPYAPEEKNLEFPYAAFGMKTLTHAMTYAWEALVNSDLCTPEQLISKFIKFPSRFLECPIPDNRYTFWSVKSGKVGEIRLFGG